jgi:CRISP-associated protein Cas1
MEVQLNTLYIMTRGASVQRDHLTVQVTVEKKSRLAVPIHHLESMALFGHVHVTSGALHLCAEHGVAVCFLSESGRLLSRVDAPSSGNVLLRRTQFRWADLPDKRAAVARCLVAGKIHNARNLLLRGARESTDNEEQRLLQTAVRDLGDALPKLANLDDADVIRGHEGNAGRIYFAALPLLVRQNRDSFAMNGRSRRPPLDPVNALLSFTYALLLNDCLAAAATTGLDPSVGYLHVDRPGRPGLALDLMEEFRPWLADRLVLTLINRQQIKPEHFVKQDTGAVLLNDAGRRAVVTAYQQRKREEVNHPLLEQKVPIGRLPFLQARILARHLRGDLDAYVPCIPRN